MLRREAELWNQDHGPPLSQVDSPFRELAEDRRTQITRIFSTSWSRAPSGLWESASCTVAVGTTLSAPLKP